MTGKKTGLKVAKKNNRAGFLFLLPLIVIFIGLLGYSFYFLISNSFRDVTITFRRSEFVGLANYQTIFKDKSFWKSLLNTFILSTANIFCGLTFGFIIAIILNFKIKGKRFFHALFFIPSMLPIALMATVFGSMLEYKNGIVNQILRGVGLGALAQRLGIKEDLIKLVKERSKLLPGYQIGKTGMIQEWIKDFEKSDLGHRHFSPVFGFHPGHSIKKTDTELVQACQNFIEEKAENFKQQIGWSCAWLINLWARLGDGTKANHYYEELLRQSVYDNLFDLHPPLGETEGEREVFQIDGNFGSASGVAEMLISSEKGKITILPALPDSWKNGKVRGLLAAGAIEVDITWKDRKPVSVSLRSSSDQNVSLFYRNRKLAEQIELKKQEQQIINLCSC